jgi:hypothetical protein
MPWMAQRGSRGIAPPMLNLGTRWGWVGGWSAPCLGHFTPGKETQYPLYRRLGVAKRKFLAPTVVWTPHCPVHSKLLYQLCYPGPLMPVQAPETQFSNNVTIINKCLKCRMSLTYERTWLIFWPLNSIFLSGMNEWMIFIITVGLS